MDLGSKIAQCWSLIFVVTLIQYCHAADQSIQDSGSPADRAAQLTARISVLLPDGTPASAAIVHSYVTSNSFTRRTATADEHGNTELQDDFHEDLRILAQSPDGRSQAVLFEPAAAIRSIVAEPLTIKLKPSTPHRVLVTVQGEPIEGAHVAVVGHAIWQTAITQADGIAFVWLPEGEEINKVVAWHPALGVGGVHGGSAEAGGQTDVSLQPPSPHAIQVVDPTGNPVVGITIAANVRTADSGWITARYIDATRAQTDDNGEVHFGWFPAHGLESVDVEVLDKGWKIDDIDRGEISSSRTTVYVRQKLPVDGHVILAEDMDPHGLLVTGSAFGPGERGYAPRARLRSDGTFTMHTPLGHAYILGVSDLSWSSEIWSGLIANSEGESQPEITLKGYAATPVEVRVTRGASREPVTGARVYVSRGAGVEWTDERGEPRSARSGIGYGARTDEDGYARAGVGLGEVAVQFSAGNWSDAKTVQVISTEPVQLSFHRGWIGNRVVTARPQFDATDYRPSLDAAILGWTGRKIHSPSITRDGSVEVKFDENEVSLLLIDRTRRLSGFAKAGINEDSVDLLMQSNATYSGTLVHRKDGSPLADYTVRMTATASFLDVAEPRQTDHLGRFEFSDLPAGVPLQLVLENHPGLSGYRPFVGREMLFTPGENRTDDVARATPKNDKLTATDRPPAGTIAERIAGAIENGRIMGMSTVVVMEGDASHPVKYTAGLLCDDRKVDAILRYFPVILTAQQQVEDRDLLVTTDWPRPKEGEIVMVILANGQDATASLRLDCADIKSALEQGAQFLQQHVPEVHDRRKKLEEARLEAGDSGRIVWVITGDSRCAPCLRLARWIDQHHETLVKDLVIVKLTMPLDEHAHQVHDEIGGVGHGIPFHALMSAEGEILIASEGPLGNIGMPGSVEGIRHFRKMLETARQRMTPADIDGLIDSLRREN